MGLKRSPGLTKRGGIWHIDKQIGGRRVRESTGTGDLNDAEELLARRITELREQRLYGARPDRTFRAAATRYLQDGTQKKRIKDDALQLRLLDPFVGSLQLKQVHLGSLQAFIEKRRQGGVKTKTINAGLAVVRRILNLAATEWIDEHGLTWLEAAPKIRLFPVKDARSPYPLSAEEEAVLFEELPDHLARMALFKVNTGLREQEVCRLRWDMEVRDPDLGTSVFVIPRDIVKNGEERLVVLNRVAQAVIEKVRGQHPTYVFVRAFKDQSGRPVTKMNNSGWKSARERAADRWQALHGMAAADGFRRVRVHDLKHTFGRRLRAAGVSFEDRQDLLGHKSGRITTHYSAPELRNLIAAANGACGVNPHKTPTVTWPQRRSG
jgi:integrase